MVIVIYHKHNTHTYRHMYVCVCVCVGMYVCMCVCPHARIYIHMYKRVVHKTEFTGFSGSGRENHVQNPEFSGGFGSGLRVGSIFARSICDWDNY